MNKYALFKLHCPLLTLPYSQCHFSSQVIQPQPFCLCSAYFGFYINNTSLLEEYLYADFVKFLCENAFNETIVPIVSSHNSPLPFHFSPFQQTDIEIMVESAMQQKTTTKKFNLFFKSNSLLCNDSEKQLLFTRSIIYKVDDQKFDVMSKYIESLKSI